MDGDVYEGKATVTVEHLTGEATPVEKQVGDGIPGGARNLDGIMIVKVFNVLFSCRCREHFQILGLLCGRFYAFSTSMYGYFTIFCRREGFPVLYSALQFFPVFLRMSRFRGSVGNKGLVGVNSGPNHEIDRRGTIKQAKIGAVAR